MRGRIAAWNIHGAGNAKKCMHHETGAYRLEVGKSVRYATLRINKGILGISINFHGLDPSLPSTILTASSINHTNSHAPKAVSAPCTAEAAACTLEVAA